MEPVKLAICHVTPAPTGRNMAAAPAAAGASWIRFGDEAAYYSKSADWPRFTESAGRARLMLREHPSLLDPRHLHVVVQKGNLFRREHPDVPVLLDKGRFLLVDMAPERVQELGAGDVSCYAVRPLEAAGAHEENRIVFAARSRTADRAAVGPPDPTMQALTARVSRASYEAVLTRLAQFPTRHSTTTHFTGACTFVEQQLSALGYPTSRQSITVNGSPSANVTARRTGTDMAPRGLVLVTAHLDSINEAGTSASRAPGADDDGSGSAGVIEIARVFKDHQGKHDLQFILFGGEEQGLLGSKAFVASMTAADQARVRAVVQMDMIGSLNTPAPTVLLEGAALSQSVIDGLASAAATYTALAVQTSLNPADSDHVPFIRKNMPAVLTIEGADRTNDAIHSARDTLDRINFDLALEILRMNTAFVAEALKG
jgi:Peptidase family M28